jgi:uncharacterized protein YfaS (alpha-2-macroglobulin family)
MNIRSLLALPLIFLFSSLPVFAQDPLVEFFSPQGTVKKVRQVRARFSEQMVPFGDPRVEDPFEIRCPEQGKGRWADGKNWVYDFDKDLPAGVVCDFRLRPGLQSISGKEIKGQQRFSFSTGGPAVISSYPREGRQIHEDQVFIVVLDAEAVEDSILSDVWFSAEGIAERIGVRIVKGKEREEILATFANHWWFQSIKESPLVVLQGIRNFPPQKTVRLVWGKGVTSVSGIPTTEDQVLPFRARGPFAAFFTCKRENAEAGCIPMLPMYIRFSAPVSWEYAGKIRMKGPNKVYGPKPPEKSQEEFVSGVMLEGPFPENTSFRVEMPPKILDDAGRSLENIGHFPLDVKTDSYPPLAKFSARFGILEKEDPVLPVTLRNLEPEVRAWLLEIAERMDEVDRGLDKVQGRLQKVEEEKEIIGWLRKVASAGRRKSILKEEGRAKSFGIPKPGGGREFEVVGIPLKKTGFYVVELESAILGASLLGVDRPMYVPTSALVTNLSAHFKWGRESSLVWVTTLDRAEPVKDAVVTIRDCRGEIVWEGKTDEQGTAMVNHPLPKGEDLPYCKLEGDRERVFDFPQMKALRRIGRGLFVFARTADDQTFVHSSWDEGIDPWRFRLPRESFPGPVLAPSVFDRTLLRAGETVYMKHIVRKHTMSGFSLVSKEDLPRAVAIRHRGSDQSYEFPLQWDPDQGIAETAWKIPQDAKLGFYEVLLLPKRPERKKGRRRYYGWREYWRSGTFRVEEYRVPLMKAVIQPPSRPIVNDPEADVDLQVTYLAGGGASGLPVKLRSRVQPKYVVFDGYRGFTFAKGEVKEGIVTRSGKRKPEEKEEKRIQTADLTLAEGGVLRARVTDIPKSPLPQDLLAELEFKDPNGEIHTVSSRIPVWPSHLLIGIKPDSWAASKEKFKFHVVSLDLTGNPVPGVDVKVDLFRQEWYSHRKRLVGGFYSYEHATETKRIGPLCEGKTDAKGLLICDVTSPVSGNVILQANALDKAGNRSITNRNIWIAGKEDWWFDVAASDRMDVLPERKRYEPGETAKFQVRMPFREATALVTVEREGILDSFITTISGKNPVVDVPVKKHYAPNVFISVLSVRGRAGDVSPTAVVDLGKPAFKLGIAEINVGWKAHELAVRVESGKTVYKVRQKAPVRISVERADGKPLPPGSEVAVAAVDEGLLELMPNGSWKLLERMMRRRGYEVRTSTAQMQVVGKRHYGRKALPEGGGGGRQVTRELFDTLLFWKGRVPLDPDGKAEVEIPLGDSLTSFRIVAVAIAGAGHFGTGHTRIRTTQDLMLFSGLPQMVRRGDDFRAGFTVRNASDRAMKVVISAKLSGGNGAGQLDDLAVDLSPGEAKETGWAVTVSHGGNDLRWEVTAKEENGDAEDVLRVRQKVVEPLPVRVFQATLLQLENTARMKVKRPPDAIPGRGGIKVLLRPRLTDELGGVLAYMRRYPYVCMEQKVSKAVALRDASLWKQVMGELPAHLDQDGLVKYFPSRFLRGSPVLTSYILSIAHEAGWKIPSSSKERMEDGLTRFIEGKIFRYGTLPTADLSIRKMSALEALSRNGKARPNLLHSITIEANLWPTSAVLDWANVLTRVKNIPDREKRLAEAEQIMKSRLNFQGTILGFSTEKTDFLWWLMCSIDTNAVRSVLAFLEFEGWKEDLPRLLRGAIGRQKKGRWDTTVANAWGVLALEKFAKKFEAVTITGQSSAELQKERRALEWGAAPDGGTLTFRWPEGERALNVIHQGKGKPWVTVQSTAAIPLKKPFSSGYRIKKTYTAVIRKNKDEWSRGDVVRVRLDLEAQADMTWVVVSDPVPAGSTVLGSGLGRDSRILTTGEKQQGYVWPVFIERSFEAFRAYYQFVPKGKWTVEYTVRLNNGGRFLLPETRVEALYSPEMLGEIPNERFVVVH